MNRKWEKYYKYNIAGNTVVLTKKEFEEYMNKFPKYREDYYLIQEVEFKK